MSITLSQLVGKIIGIINLVIPVLISVALVFFIIGLVRYIYESADAHGHTEGKNLIVWGLVAMFILVSVWGILSVMREALNLY